MFALIVGCSEIGYHLTKALMAAGHEVLVVEKDRDRYRLLTEELGGVALHGDGTDERILREAGAARAEVFFALTGRDETNLVACQLTKHVFNTPRTLALIRDPKNESVFHFLGVDVVVNSVQLLLAYLEEGIPGRPMVHLRDLPEPGDRVGQCLYTRRLRHRGPAVGRLGVASPRPDLSGHQARRTPASFQHVGGGS